MHVTSQEDIEKEVAMKQEEETLEQIRRNMKLQRQFDRSMHDVDETYDYNHITYLQDYKKNSNFSYLQSIFLIAAFIAGSNRESTDIKLFEIDKSKFRIKNTTNNAGTKNGVHLAGKTKRFSIDRLIAIVDYFSSLEIEV